jgi:hypothetical protein
MTPLSPDDEMASPELAPLRLIEGGAGEHERSLVASARLDRVPSAAKARVAAALGGVLVEGGGVRHEGDSGSAEGAARGNALHRLGTRSAIGVLGGGVVGAVALSLWLRAPHDDDRAATSAKAASSASHAVAAPSAPQPETSSTALSAAPQLAPARSDRSNAQSPSARALTARAAPAEAGLLAEVRALEAVRSALAAKRTERAARDLDAYRRRFARGELAIEADVLAIELSLARGERQAAHAAADRLLARPEAQHYQGRVRALLERHERSMAAPGEDASRDRSNLAGAHMRARR